MFVCNADSWDWSPSLPNSIIKFSICQYWWGFSWNFNISWCCTLWESNFLDLNKSLEIYILKIITGNFDKNRAKDYPLRNIVNSVSCILCYSFLSFHTTDSLKTLFCALWFLICCLLGLLLYGFHNYDKGCYCCEE